MLLHIVMTQLFLNSKKSLGNKIKISYLASLFRDPPFRSIFHENWTQFLKTKQRILKKVKASESDFEHMRPHRGFMYCFSSLFSPSECFMLHSHLFFNHTNTWNTRGKFGFRYLDKEKNVHFFKTSNYFSLFSLQSVKIITLSYYYIYNICALLDKPAKPDRQYASTKLNIFL